LIKKLIPLFLLLAMPGCNPQPAPAMPKETFMPIRFLALGDSYTIGEGVPEADRWPNQLTVRLRGNGYDTEIAIIA
jgi:lysophospholipase L1-like esterase